MASELILLTGATGLIGFRVLVFCLREGYRVRVAVRSLASKGRILGTLSVQQFGAANNLTFVQITDISVPGAFDEALQDVDYVIHAAAPIASTDATTGVDLVAHFFKPTVDAAIHLLESGRSHSTVKRVILTNSLAGLVDHGTDLTNTIFTESTRGKNIQQPPYNSGFEAYIAAKVSTLNSTEQWVKSMKPTFDVVHMAPGHVFGPHELVTDPDELLRRGSNRIILAPIMGKAYNPEPGLSVHIDDVAQGYVRALNLSTPGNRLYILNSGNLSGTTLDDCFEIVARCFPDHIGGILPNNGSLPSYTFKVDASESERILGIKFIPYEQQVRDAVGYYIQCVQQYTGFTPLD